MTARPTELAPGQIRTETIRALNQLFQKMMSAEWDLALDGATGAQKANAIRLLGKVQRARMKLRTAQLAGIRDKLKQNEAGLRTGKAALERAARNLRNVEAVLNAGAGLLAIVARVVAL